MADSPPRVLDGIHGLAQADHRAVEREVGAFEVGVGPDQLEDLVLGHAALAAVEQEREQGLGLPAAGLVAAPALDRPALALDAQRAEGEHGQAGRSRPVEDHRGVERRCLLLDVGPVLGQPRERVQLCLLLAAGAQRGADEGGRLADERLVRRPERASGVGRSHAQLADAAVVRP